MRSEKEMFDLIINVAKEDKRIRAVYMNGSRTNINVPKDIFQDYDVVYVVNETESFRQNKNWIDVFGARLYMQLPEETDIVLGLGNEKTNSCYGWLIQFTDGNRLDLHVETIEFTNRHFLDDKLCMILLDKDNILPEIGESTDKDYWVKKPVEAEFLAAANEFWWCLNNVAKGLWRKEVPYVLDMLNHYIRTELVTMLSWKVGILTDFSVSVGKSGKYMYRWLSPDTWERFLATYSGADIKEIWNSVFIMCDLFNDAAREIAMELEFSYNETEAENSRGWLERVKELPDNAEDIYTNPR